MPPVKRLNGFATILFSAGLATASWAGLGPENVLLVVNGASADSLRVANAYVNLRKIPSCNVVVLDKLTSTEFTDAEKFRSEIMQPVLAAIEARGLKKQIDCITYSVDIPYSVNVSGDVKGRKLSQVITQTASTNGLTYLMDWALKGDIDYLRLDINTYARRRTPIPKGADLTSEELAKFGEAMSKYDAKDFKGAIEGLSKLLEVERSDPTIAYNLACCYSLNRQGDEAIAALRKAVASGWRNSGQAGSDPDFEYVRTRPEFLKLLRLMQTANVAVQPAVPFRRSAGWNRMGENDPAGAKYMLSTFLGVTAGRGNSVEEIIDSLRRAKSADFTSPKGTIFFEKNGDVRSTTREWGFQAAADELNRLGVNAIVEEGILPKNRTSVAGAMIGIADFDWKASGSSIAPGAILEHLTRLGGMINKGAGQTPCTEFIRAGAAGSSGTVTEPYALQEKFPSPFIHVHYAKGFTLAEAFYLSVTGPYQLLIIGDPMCRPWGKKAELKLGGLAGQKVSKVVTVKPVVTPNIPVKQFFVYVDGRLVSTAKPAPTLSIPVQSLAEGYHELTVAAELDRGPADLVRSTTEIMVAGTNKSIKVPSRVESSLDGNLVVDVSAAGATKVELMHCGRAVGSCGAKGSITIPSRVVGQGETTLYPVASYGSAKVYGKPISISVR